MIYFDNAATGFKKPASVMKAVNSSLKICFNPGRSGHKLSVAGAGVVRNARAALSSLFGGSGPDRVIFTKNCTEALNVALFGLLKQGDHVVTTCMEHNSVLRPLEAMKKAGRIDYTVVGLKNGKLDDTELKKSVKKQTRLAAITLCSNVTGYAPDIRKIKELLPEDALLVCDGAQACGHMEIDMKAQGIDALAVAGHKGLNGIQGGGALLFSERAKIQPLLYGGTGSMSLSLDQPDFYPDALESGTLNFPAIVSLFEGALYTRLHLKENAEKIYSLTEYLHSALKRNPHILLYSEPNASGIVAFAHQKYPSEEAAGILSEKFGIYLRGGFHCAPLMHKALKTDEDGLLRASLSEFNLKEECDEFLRAVRLI